MFTGPVMKSKVWIPLVRLGWVSRYFQVLLCTWSRSTQPRSFTKSRTVISYLPGYRPFRDPNTASAGILCPPPASIMAKAMRFLAIAGDLGYSIRQRVYFSTYGGHRPGRHPVPTRPAAQPAPPAHPGGAGAPGRAAGHRHGPEPVLRAQGPVPRFPGGLPAVLLGGRDHGLAGPGAAALRDHGQGRGGPRFPGPGRPAAGLHGAPPDTGEPPLPVLSGRRDQSRLRGAHCAVRGVRLPRGPAGSSRRGLPAAGGGARGTPAFGLRGAGRRARRPDRAALHLPTGRPLLLARSVLPPGLQS